MGKAKLRIASKIALFLALYCAVLGSFCNLSPGDEMGWTILVFWFIVPAATLLASMLIQLDLERTVKRVPVPANITMIVLFGAASMMLPLLTFGLMAGGGVREYFSDSIPQFMIGAIASLVGIAIGKSISVDPGDGLSEEQAEKRTKKRAALAALLIIAVPVILVVVIGLINASAWN